MELVKHTCVFSYSMHALAIGFSQNGTHVKFVEDYIVVLLYKNSHAKTENHAGLRTMNVNC
jgi:hypothetical protein